MTTPAPPLTAVPAAEDMSDANFARHVHRRHAQDFPNWGSFFKNDLDPEQIEQPKWLATWVPAWRAYHERMHALEPFGPYNHEHNLPRSNS